MKFPYIVNLTYIFNDKGEVLLQKKARGFGVGNWNGPGGKVELGETPAEGAIREVEEETGLRISKLEPAGEIEFVFDNNHDSNNYTYVYRALEWSGIPEDKGEGELKWFKIDEIPLDKMWDDDQYWLPDVLRGGHVHKRFHFNEDSKVIKNIDL
jgi:8-oxo-dGTP diphosphatase